MFIPIYNWKERNRYKFPLMKLHKLFTERYKIIKDKSLVLNYGILGLEGTLRDNLFQNYEVLQMQKARNWSPEKTACPGLHHSSVWKSQQAPTSLGIANRLPSFPGDFQEYNYSRVSHQIAQLGSITPRTRDPYAPPTHVLWMVWKSCWPSRETPALIA